MFVFWFLGKNNEEQAKDQKDGWKTKKNEEKSSFGAYNGWHGRAPFALGRAWPWAGRAREVRANTHDRAPSWQERLWKLKPQERLWKLKKFHWFPA